MLGVTSSASIIRASRTGLDVLRAKGLSEQRIVEQVDLADCKGAPVGIKLCKVVIGERVHA